MSLAIVTLCSVHSYFDMSIVFELFFKKLVFSVDSHSIPLNILSSRKRASFLVLAEGFYLLFWIFAKVLSFSSTYFGWVLTKLEMHIFLSVFIVFLFSPSIGAVLRVDCCLFWKTSDLKTGFSSSSSDIYSSEFTVSASICGEGWLLDDFGGI